ncbi:MAG: peptidoglycan-binding domain-containing protein [Ruthenibacterium lactatiformans]
MWSPSPWRRPGCISTAATVLPRAAAPRQATPPCGAAARSTYVLILQDALNALGFANRPLDGIFGGGTENAVRAFQRAVSLTADGICGCNTWKKLTAASVGIGRTRTVID